MTVRIYDFSPNTPNSFPKGNYDDTIVYPYTRERGMFKNFNTAGYMVPIDISASPNRVSCKLI